MRIVVMICVLACSGASYAQQVYKCADANGNPIYTQRPCSDDPDKVEVVDTSRALKTGSGLVAPPSDLEATASEIGRKVVCDRRERAITDRYQAEYARIDRQISDYGQQDRAFGDELKARKAELQRTEKRELKQAAKACKDDLSKPPELAREVPAASAAADSSWRCIASNGEVFYRHSACPPSIDEQRLTRMSDTAPEQLIVIDVPVRAEQIPRSEACRQITSPDAPGRNGSDRDEKAQPYDKLQGRDPC